MKDPESIHKYAAYVLKARWPEAEPHIMKDPMASSYAIDVLNHRWREAEPYIGEDSVAWAQYAAEFGL